MDNMGHVVISGAADPADAEELTVRNAGLAAQGVSRVELQVIV